MNFSDCPLGSTRYGGDEKWGLQRGAAGETVFSSQPVYLPAPQRVR